MSSESLNTAVDVKIGSNLNSNLNPPSSSGLFVRIESVYLLIHYNSRIFRKLLAPEPQTFSPQNSQQFYTDSEFSVDHFIKTIHLIETLSIQFEFNFRIVGHKNNNNNNNTNNNNSEINLLFHEILLENIKTCSFYVENMGKFTVSPDKHSYQYLTTPSAVCYKYGESLYKNLSLRLEIVDLDRTAWFIGEWRVRFQTFDSEIENWLMKGSNNSTSFENNLKIPTSRAKSFDDFEEVKYEDLNMAQSRPSNASSRSPSPLSRSNSSESASVSVSVSVSASESPKANSISASFEDLDLNDFIEFNSRDDSLSLPKGANSPSVQDQRLLFAEELSLPPPSLERKNSLVPSRTVSPKPRGRDEDLSTVDIINQVGTNLISSRWGQLVTLTMKTDPKEQHLKASYSTSAIHLLGVKYQLQGCNSNVLLMESEVDPELIEIKRIERFNSFSSLLKRIQAPTTQKLMILREVLLLKRSGPIVSARLKAWFESFNGWIVEEFTPAILRVFFHGITIEIKIFSLKPNSNSPANTPDLFLVDLKLFQALNPYSSGLNTFQNIAEANAFFVELTAFTVQLEMCEARRAPEIVLMETWNSHLDAEQLCQSETVPIVKYSVIPQNIPGPFSIMVYFWSDHLQGWLLQTLSIQGMILSIHPLIDARMAIQINLSGSHVKVSKDKNSEVGNFTLITSRGQVYYFRVVKVENLKEIIGRIRFATLSRRTQSNESNESNEGNKDNESNESNKSNETGNATVSVRSKQRQGSLLQADKIYRGNSSQSPSHSVSEEELERIRKQNLSVMDSFLEDFRSRFWFTYRRNFPRIEPTLFTTDLGWGCMLRTGQCLMAEALTRFFFGRNWRLWQITPDDSDQISEKTAIMKKYHTRILSQFIDQSSGEYSVHRLAVEGAKIGTPIGQWFGPSIIGKVLKSITNNLNDSPFWVYLSSDGTFPTSHLLKIVNQRAVLILLPLRLGIDRVNPLYAQFIRGALRSESSLGIVGGLPSKSLYFVGYQDWELLFLDPHILKPFDPTAFLHDDHDKLINDYHTSRVRSIPIEEIDPSMLFGFMCYSADELVRLRDHLTKLNRHANILSIKH